MRPARPTIVSCVLAAGVFAQAAFAVRIETVPVGDPGNAADTRFPDTRTGATKPSFGSVGYTFQMGKFDVTAGQYTAFLNAVARTDTHGLYNGYMDYDPRPSQAGCNIKRNGTVGNYTYTVAPDWANRPVNYVSWGDAARFANWLSNGQPTTGEENTETTEDGSYALNRATDDGSLLAVMRKSEATWVIPTEDEWYKAAFYDTNKPGGAGYWDFPTGSSTAPSNLLDPNGTNNANFTIGTYPNSVSTLGAPYWRTEVGAFAGSPGPYGTYDQAGNVWQWNETTLFGTSRMMLGGAYNLNADPHMLADHRVSLGPTSEYRNLGFRVAYIPEPATLVLLLFGGLTVTRRTRPQASR